MDRWGREELKAPAVLCASGCRAIDGDADGDKQVKRGLFCSRLPRPPGTYEQTKTNRCGVVLCTTTTRQGQSYALQHSSDCEVVGASPTCSVYNQQPGKKITALWFRELVLRIVGRLPVRPCLLLRSLGGGQSRLGEQPATGQGLWDRIGGAAAAQSHVMRREDGATEGGVCCCSQ